MAKKQLTEAEIQIEINKMTNWQRTQWARNGYKKGPGNFKHFLALKHWKAKASAKAA